MPDDVLLPLAGRTGYITKLVFAPVLVGSALGLAAARDEGAIALRVGRRSITYGELDSLASGLAFALEQRGVGPGDRVATRLGGAESVVAFWAIAKAGAVGVALDDQDLEELAETLRELDARAFVVDAALAPTFHHAIARVPNLRAVIVRGRRADVDATGTAVYVPYDTALAEEDPRAEAPPPRCIDLDDAWLERDEDGGRCALSHRVLLARAASLAVGLDLAPGDAVSGAPMCELAVACAVSGASFRAPDGEPDAPSGEGRALWIGAVDEERGEEPGVKAIRLHRSIAAGPIAVAAGGTGPARVLPNVDVRIVDDGGAEVAPKVVGEIELRSSSLAEAVSASGAYFRTGDSGMLDDAGALYVL